MKDVRKCVTHILFSYNCIQNVHILLLEMWSYESIKIKKLWSTNCMLWFCFCNALRATICHWWHVQQQVSTVGSDSVLSGTYVTVSHYSFRAVQTGRIPKIMKYVQTEIQWAWVVKHVDSRSGHNNIKVLFQNLHHKTAGNKPVDQCLAL
jgi:hypothetical protein